MIKTALNDFDLWRQVYAKVIMHRIKMPKDGEN